MQYTVWIIWALGAVSVILTLLCIVSNLAWRVLCGVKGWRVVFAALRAYRDAHQGEGLDGPL